MIQENIQSLLYDHDCVVIPGFGGIIGAYQSAQLDPMLHVLSPPRKQLTFNPRLVHNDGLLATAVSLEKGIPYAEALVLVEREVRDIKAALAGESRFDLSDVGLFFVDKEKTLQFRPHDRINYLKDSFGLARITLVPVAKGETPVIPISLPNIKAEDKVNWGRIAAVAAFPVALALGIWQFGGDVEMKSALSFAGRFQTKTAEYIPKKNEVKEALQAEADEFEAFLQSNKDAETAAFAFDGETLTTIRLKNPTPDVSSIESGNHFLIAGAFKMEENAHRQVEALKAEGFGAVLVGMKGELHLVAMSGHATLQEANQAKSKSDKKGVWIYSK